MPIRPLILALLAGVATPAAAAEGPAPVATGAASPLSPPQPKGVVVPGPNSVDAPRPTLTQPPATADAAAPATPTATPQATPTQSPTTQSSAPRADGDMRDLFSGRGGDVPASIRALQADGARIVSMGSEGGAKGYLGEAQNGRFQMFYASPDGEHEAVGLLFRSGGVDVTNAQVEAMLRRFGEAAGGLPGAADLPPVPADGGAARATSDLPMMDWFRSKGFKVTPFGDGEGGFPAYMVETPPVPPSAKGRLQSFYVMPDPRFAVAGLLVRRGGVNVTGLQIAHMRQREVDEAAAAGRPASSAVLPGIDPPSVPAPTPDVAKVLEGAAVPPPAAAPALPVVSADPAPATDATPRPPVALPPGRQGAVIPPQVPPVREAALPAPTMTDLPLSTKPASASAAFRSPVPRDAFVEALKTTRWFSVGDADAPVIYMVVDPQCPFCHATWQKLKPLVFARKLQVRVVMIAGLAGSDPIARSILSRRSPAEAWLTGEGSIHGFPVAPGPLPGTPDWDRAGNMLAVNANLIRNFRIDRTPFIAYVADDGTMYSSLGLPDDLDAFLAARRRA